MGGRAEAGEIVSIGPYIYQIRLKSGDPEEVRNGIIVVGKWRGTSLQHL